MSEQKFGFRIKWLGCACFEMDFSGVTVVSDPWITANVKNDVTWENVERCDYITLSHGHYDHTLDIPALVEKFQSRVLCGEFTAMPLMRWLDINPMSMYPMTPNLELNFDAVKIRALFGRHTPLPGGAKERLAAEVARPVNAGDPNLIELGNCGNVEYRNYLFTMPNGTKVLIWGNRMKFADQRNILRETQPDIAILQMTTSDNASELAAEICRDSGCKVVIPHHFDFPNDCMPFVNAFGEELAKNAPEIRYIVPKCGEWIEL